MSTVAVRQAEEPLILSIDVGTSSVRALLFDGAGRRVEEMMARCPFGFSTTAEGAAEADPRLLLMLVCRSVDDLLERASPLVARIGGVAMCTFVGNILGVDETGTALTPLLTYADTRSAKEVEELRAELEERAVHQRTGCLFHTSYLPAQFRWFARAEPDVFKRVARWMSIGEYVERRLFGDSAVTYSVASWTGLLDRHRLAWDASLLSALPVVGEQLSPLTDVDRPRRGLLSQFANRWPALRDVPWFPAVGDGATANIGSGCATPNRVALTLGTTGAVRLVTDKGIARVPPGLWCYRVDRHRDLPGGALSEGGNLFAWMLETLRLPVLADLDASLAGMNPDAHGLTVLPFLTGERSPGWAGNAQATLHGLSLSTTPLDILQAGMEAVAYRIRLIFDLLQPLLPDRVEVIASGGALLSSTAWLQIVADVLGRPVAPSQVREASARGAALLALEALGAVNDLAAAPAFVGTPIEPDEERHKRYQEAARRQRALYERMVGRKEMGLGGHPSKTDASTGGRTGPPSGGR